MASVEVKAMVAATEFVTVCLTMSAKAEGTVWEKPVPATENTAAMQERNARRTRFVVAGVIVDISLGFYRNPIWRGNPLSAP